ncbi:hypothetical protein LTR10_023152 [Elasticomyces elasticus]|uniref:GDP/GTP exchange factor Sec2 N-terminal domain-containing protein n=1 Tax=Exophiala sideris TaxID=1016849 RepID=A0ABR0JHB6_9EURO|nr:hypothetical protein LTR10_023152 [Elasticomyces elasticus]KAK5033528.1 hypothetical protein LTS07_003833 [Exophiala sideris]KAK5041977.1 hypothetical protein LTR13_001782 [Exophiala sideris]KAK5064072.1 hypothetical protein LTR69_003841 [Exophiala sideris]KAK5185245.1 hypothetical protein LTR44_002233 [Eurotiomycetes sp. CCFEE 6388]
MATEDAQVPSSPPPQRTRSADSMNKSAYASPPPMSASMTPPPSTQPPRFHSPVNRIGLGPSEAFLASPPYTGRVNVLRALPTPDAIAKADIEELRNIARELVAAVQEARTSAAHFKLQHSLLAMESEEAAQRAEVESQMTRREIEVLQTVEHRNRASFSMRNSQPPSQPQIEALTRTCRVLEDERDEAEHEVLRVKKSLEFESDRVELLLEENTRLKKRIRDNREHFSRLKSLSPSYNTPRDAFTTPQRKAVPRFAESAPNQNNIAALLAADQIISRESLSVPSTPTKTHTSKLKHGHSRGAHSLSSLHNTPVQQRPSTQDGYPESMVPFSAPASQLVIESAERERHDRDSTISISDAEDGSDDNIPQSQASSLASDMLRRNPGPQESLRLSQNAERTSNLLQSKLFGPVKKSAHSKKRGASFGESDIQAKKAKTSKGVGLGIESWSQ